MAGVGTMVTKVLLGGVLIGATVALSACSPVTYGTGTRPTVQTVKDATRMLNFRRPDPILYQPRPDLVIPPTTTLPPPGSDGTP